MKGNEQRVCDEQIPDQYLREKEIFSDDRKELGGDYKVNGRTCTLLKNGKITLRKGCANF